MKNYQDIPDNKSKKKMRKHFLQFYREAEIDEGFQNDSQNYKMIIQKFRKFWKFRFVQGF